MTVFSTMPFALSSWDYNSGTVPGCGEECCTTQAFFQFFTQLLQLISFQHLVHIIRTFEPSDKDDWNFALTSPRSPRWQCYAGNVDKDSAAGIN